MKNDFDQLVVKNMFKKHRLKLLIFFGLLAILLGLLLFEILRNQLSITFSGLILAVIYFIFIYFVHLVDKRYKNNVTSILTNQLELQKYGAYLNYALKRERGVKRETLFIEKGILQYYLGNFDFSKDLLSNRKSKHQFIELKRLFYLALNNLEQMNKESVEYTINQMITLQNYNKQKQLQDAVEFLGKIKAMYFDMRSIQDIDLMNSKSHLDNLHKTYYQAKNELLKGDTERACELFQKVAVENDDIYFVREAKRILGELSHDRT